MKYFCDMYMSLLLLALTQIYFVLAPHLSFAVDQEFLQRINKSSDIEYLVRQFKGSDFSKRRYIYLRLEKLTKSDPRPLFTMVKSDSSLSREATEILSMLGTSQAEDLLIRLLTDENERVRWYAGRAVMCLQNKSFFNEVFGLLDDDKEYVRSSAEKVIFTWGYDAIDFIQDILPELDKNVRAQIVGILARVEHVGCSPEDKLRRDYLKSEDVELLLKSVRKKYSGVKKDFNEQYDSKLNNLLIKILTNDEPYVRLASLEALKKRANPAAVPYLVELLEDKDEYFQYRARIALSDYGSSATKPLLDALLEKKGEVRTTIAEILLNNSCPSENSLFVPLLTNKDEFIRQAGITLLGKTKDKKTICEISALMHHEKNYVKEAAQSTLIRIGSDAVECIQQFVVSDQVQVHRFALDTLYLIIDSETKRFVNKIEKTNGYLNISFPIAYQKLPSDALEHLVDNLASTLSISNVNVRRVVANELRKIGNEKAISVLIQLLSDSSEDVQKTAVWNLNSLGEKSLPALKRAMSDSRSVVRCNAIKSMAFLGKKGDMEPFEEALHDSDIKVREVVVETLANLGSPKAIEILISLLSSDNIFFQNKVIKSLGRLGLKAEEQLVNALSDDALKLGAATALAMMASVKSIQPLIAVYEEQKAEVRSMIAFALEKFPDDRRVFDFYNRALNDPVRNIRYQAINYFRKVTKLDCFEILETALSNIHEEVNKFALEELSKSNAPGKVDLLVLALQHRDYLIVKNAGEILKTINEGRLEDLLLPLVDDESFYTRKTVMSLLAEKFSNSRNVFNALKNKIHHVDLNEARIARKAMFRLKTQQAVDTLFSMWQWEWERNIHDNDTTEDLIISLWEMNDSRTIEVIATALQYKRNGMSCAAAKAIDVANINAPQLVPILVAFLERDSCVTDSAKRALIRIGRPSSEALIPVLKSGSEIFLLNALPVLGSIGDVLAIEEIARALDSESALVREVAVKSLSMMENDKILPYLTKSLKDENKHVRIESARGLGSLRNISSIPSLIKALDDKEVEVQREVMCSLQIITENNFKKIPGKWKEWWRYQKGKKM